MLANLLSFSIRQRYLVVFVSVVIAMVGLYNFTILPVDAIPDITNNQVEINTEVPGMAPQEVERYVTWPVEISMSGLPKVKLVRSLSRYGLSQVTVIFDDGVDIYWARQLISERLQVARDELPEGIPEPSLGPIATGLGEIAFWSVENEDGISEKRSQVELRTIQDWVVRPQVLNVRGITEVNSIGGHKKQIHVLPDLDKLSAYNLTVNDVIEVVQKNNQNKGGSFIEHNGNQFVIRSQGIVKSLQDLKDTVVKVDHSIPVLLGDIAKVEESVELRTGAATVNGKEAVVGTAIMLKGENSRTVANLVYEKLEEIQKTLPKGVKLRTLYNRTSLVDATMKTVWLNLFEGALLVITILFLLVGNFRAALISALAVPMSLLIGVIGMVHGGISATLMSLGAVDFGLVVDGAIIIVENCVRRLSEHDGALSQRQRLRLCRQAALEVLQPALFGQLIILIVYVPILLLQGIEGRMFQPMAITVLMVLGGAIVLSFTLVPALCAIFLGEKTKDHEPALMRFLASLYEKSLNKMMSKGAIILACICLFVGFMFWKAGSMGRVFIPKLGEGALAVGVSRIPSISLSESQKMQKQMETKLLKEFPNEIKHVFNRLGTAEVATDPVGPNHADTFIMLNPKEQWTKANDQKELEHKVDEVLDQLPGQNLELSQPIALRFNCLLSGVKTDLAIKVFGDDWEKAHQIAAQIAERVKEVGGSADVSVEQIKGFSMLSIDIDRKAIQRYGLTIDDVQNVIEAALAGKDAGTWFEGDRRFEIMVKLPEVSRTDINTIKKLPVALTEEARGHHEIIGQNPSSFAGSIPLERIAKIGLVEGPLQISRENGKRRVVVQCNVRGRDMGSFLDEVRLSVADIMEQLPEGYWIQWGGDFENYISAKERLMYVVPLVLGLIVILLFTAVRNIKDVLIVLVGVPFAISGGLFGLWYRGMPIGISAIIGFVALSGICVLNGVVLVNFIQNLRKRGVSLKDSIKRGSLIRLRPIIMTALTDALGFLPMMLSVGLGAEVQRPLATVVVCGIFSDTVLTLLVVPFLYYVFHKKEGEQLPDHLTEE